MLIADEPTTALDVTVQAQILTLMRELQRDFGTAIIIMITHDLGVVAGLCDQVLVLYGGQVMEQGPAESIFTARPTRYTAGLAAVPKLDGAILPWWRYPHTAEHGPSAAAGLSFLLNVVVWLLPQCASIRPVLGPAPTMPPGCGLCRQSVQAVAGT